MGYDTGADRLLLWLPVMVKHTITSVSPLAAWSNMSGFLADADSCIAVVIEGYMCAPLVGCLHLQTCPSQQRFSVLCSQS